MEAFSKTFYVVEDCLKPRFSYEKQLMLVIGSLNHRAIAEGSAQSTCRETSDNPITTMCSIVVGYFRSILAGSLSIR